MATDAAAGASVSYPVQLSIQRADRQSRLLGFPLGIGLAIRAILLIPHFIVLYALSLVLGVMYFIATFAILFTGRYPRGMFDFYVGIVRWQINVYAYLLRLYDNYPPFALAQQAGYVVQFGVDYPEQSSRLLNLPFIGIIIKMIVAIPHLIILYVLYLAALVVTFIGAFWILFTGAYPEGLHSFVVGVFRWAFRVQTYLLAGTDRYPPFSLK